MLMQFALDEHGNRILPYKHGRGICPVCESPVIAKCGNKRRHHWAHETIHECKYSQREETEWHRMWKQQFPLEWQEVALRDSTGERHISDVRIPFTHEKKFTSHDGIPGGLTIEFQHSPISQEERTSREHFYSSVGSMVWIVDGAKYAELYYSNCLLRTSAQGYSDAVTQSQHTKIFLPEEWLSSKVIVIFDFSNSSIAIENPSKHNELICVIRSKNKIKHFFIPIEKELFIELCKKNSLFTWIKHNKLEHKTIQTIQANIKMHQTLTSRTRSRFISKDIYTLERELGILPPSKTYHKKKRPSAYSKKRNNHSSFRKKSPKR